MVSNTFENSKVRDNIRKFFGVKAVGEDEGGTGCFFQVPVEKTLQKFTSYKIFIPHWNK